MSKRKPGTGGKGDRNRSYTEEYRDGWDRIFGSKEKSGREEPAAESTSPKSQDGLSEET